MYEDIVKDYLEFEKKETDNYGRYKTLDKLLKIIERFNSKKNIIEKINNDTKFKILFFVFLLIVTSLIVVIVSVGILKFDKYILKGKLEVIMPILYTIIISVYFCYGRISIKKTETSKFVNEYFRKNKLDINNRAVVFNTEEVEKLVEYLKNEKYQGSTITDKGMKYIGFIALIYAIIGDAKKIKLKDIASLTLAVIMLVISLIFIIYFLYSEHNKLRKTILLRNLEYLLNE